MKKREHIGKLIKAFRVDNHYTQKRMAEFLGLSRATVARLEAGGPCYDITRGKIEKIIGNKAVAA